MGLYVNRIRYKGGSPRLGASSGVINNAVVDGYYFYDDNYNPPEIDYTKEYLTITSFEDNNTCTFSWYSGAQNINSVSYSKDKTNWTKTTSSGNINVYLNKGEKVYFKASVNYTSGFRYGAFDTTYSSFHCTKKWEVSGNLMSMVYEDNFIDKTTFRTVNEHCFLGFFCAGNYDVEGTTWATLMSAKHFVCPITQITGTPHGCFARMFQHQPLIYAPKEMIYNEGSTVPSNFFWGTFKDCTLLQETPLLNFTSFGSGTCTNCFNNASSLKRCKSYVGSGSSQQNFISATNGIFYIKNSSQTASNKPSSWTTRYMEGTSFISIWAETETPYDGIVAGCSDYFVAGDSVTLTYVAVNGTFAGYYDENDNLLSSNSTYTFTAQRSMKIKVKTT